MQVKHSPEFCELLQQMTEAKVGTRKLAIYSQKYQRAGLVVGTSSGRQADEYVLNGICP